MLLNISLIFIIFIFSYRFPKAIGWLLIFFVPLLQCANFTFIPSSFMPLTTVRVSFFAILGIILSGYCYPLSISDILRIKLVKLLILFSIIVFLISLQDTFYHYLVSFLPQMFVSIFLGFVVIKNKTDLNKLVTIFAWQGAIFGLVILLEYFDIIDMSAYLSSSRADLTYEDVYFRHIVSLRSGYYRASGLDGAVGSAYRLAFLFPVTLWYGFKKGFVSIIPVILVFVGLILTQTRAAIIAVAIVLVIIFFFANISLRGKIGRYIFLGLAMLLLIFVVFPGLLTIVDSFIQHTLYPTLTGIDVSTQIKMLRIPRAINYFLDNPILGYGSPKFVYFNLMQTDDIPAPLIYFLSGGIFLGGLYLYIMYHIITQTYKLSRMLSINKEEKELLFFLSIAFLAGFIPLFSNWQEAHFMTMFILFISIYKVYVLNQSTPHVLHDEV